MNSKIKNILYYLPRKSLTKLRFFYATGKKLDLNNPKDFNEKVVYLMLNEFGEKEKNCADKLMVREYVSKKGLDIILTKLYGKYDNAYEIEFEKLPKEYVLKTNHGCGCTIIKNENKDINITDSIKKLNESLKKNYARETLEYHYEKIRPCILCEEYLKEDEKNSPTDYKIFCFNGKAHFLLVCGNRDTQVKKTYYNLDWKKINCTKNEQEYEFEKPENYNEMISIAEKLSEDFKFVRVDLYNINGKIYFGELTFTPRGGINNTIKKEYLDKWGDLIKL